MSSRYRERNTISLIPDLVWNSSSHGPPTVNELPHRKKKERKKKPTIPVNNILTTSHHRNYRFDIYGQIISISPVLLRLFPGFYGSNISALTAQSYKKSYRILWSIMSIAKVIRKHWNASRFQWRIENAPVAHKSATGNNKSQTFWERSRFSSENPFVRKLPPTTWEPARHFYWQRRQGVMLTVRLSHHILNNHENGLVPDGSVVLRHVVRPISRW